MQQLLFIRWRGLWTLISDGSDPYNRLVLSIALPNMSQVLQLKTIITWFISVHNVPMTSVACFSLVLALFISFTKRLLFFKWCWIERFEPVILKLKDNYITNIRRPLASGFTKLMSLILCISWRMPLFTISPILRLEISGMNVHKRQTVLSMPSSVTRWLDYFSIFGDLQQEKVAPEHNNLPK